MEEKEEVMKEYLEFKKTTITTESALKVVERYTNMFLNSSKKPLSKFEEKDVVKFFNFLDNKFLASSSNDIKVMVKVFIKWYYSDWSQRFRNLDKLCKKKKVEPKYGPDDMLKKEDIEKLVQEEKEPRWKAFWLIYFYGGFRPSEVCNLKWDNVTFDGDEAYITLKATKNGRVFEKYIPDNAVFYLKKIQNNGSKYIFPTKRKYKNVTKKNEKIIPVGDKPMTHSGVYQHLRDIAPKVFGKRINPYILRHSIATILYNKDNVKDDDAAQQMGHSTNMKRTYSHPTKKQIREQMRKLYIKAEDLPPEKKAELEEKIEKLTKRLKTLEKAYEELFNLNVETEGLNTKEGLMSLGGMIPIKKNGVRKN